VNEKFKGLDISHTWITGESLQERRFASIGSVGVRISSDPMFQN
jgi:hypothetical protein